ncbi:MAG: PAS domain S-box protein [Planctomycetota bacterium]|jgi:PAS domain S-box-containing protein
MKGRGMREQHRSKKELIQELETLRRRVAEFETVRARPTQQDPGPVGLMFQDYRHLADNIPDVIFTVDNSGNVSFVNKAVKDILGFEPEEVLGKNFIEFIPTGEACGARETFRRILKGERTEGERVIFDKHGAPRHIEFSSVPIVREGCIEGAVGVLRDIEKRKQAEAALNARKEMMHGILNAVTESILLIDNKGTVLAANETAAQRFGKKAEELIGMTPADFIDQGLLTPALTKSRMQFVATVFETGKPGHFEDVRNEIAYRTTYYPVFDSQGRVEKVAVFAADITAQKRAEERLTASQERYRELAENLKELVYRANPITFEPTYVNKAIENIYGYTPEEWLANPCLWESTIHPDDKERVWSEFAKAQEKQQDGQVEYRIKTKDGRVRCVEDRFTWKKDREGSVTWIYGVMSDITKRKQAEAALRESEQKWRSLTENVPDIILNVKPDGTIAFLNRAVPPITTEGAVGTSIYEHVLAEYRDTLRKSLEKVLETARPVTYELAGTGPGGRVSWYQARMGPVIIEGQVVAVTIIATDATERRKMESALRDSEARYKTLFEGAGEGILVADIETKQFRYANPAMCKMMGYTAEELRRMGVHDIHPKEDLERVIAEFEGQARGEKALSPGLPCLRKDGTIFYADINTTRAVIDGRDCNVGFFTDVTQRIKAEQALNDLAKRVAQAERFASLGALAATMVHEMAQPLTVIRISTQNALEELKDASPSDALREYMEDSIREITNSISVIDRFRDFARTFSEETASKTNVGTILKRILSLLDTEIKAADLSVRLKGIRELPTIYANEAQLEQLFFAIIQNAVQAIDDKAVHRLIISALARDDHIQLRFFDNGCGIAAENLDKVFDPFFTTKPRGEATGLGLSIVEHVLTRIGGDAWVASKPDKGSTFFVTLPVSKSGGFE